MARGKGKHLACSTSLPSRAPSTVSYSSTVTCAARVGLLVASLEGGRCGCRARLAVQSTHHDLGCLPLAAAGLQEHQRQPAHMRQHALCQRGLQASPNTCFCTTHITAVLPTESLRPASAESTNLTRAGMMYSAKAPAAGSSLLQTQQQQRSNTVTQIRGCVWVREIPHLLQLHE